MTRRAPIRTPLPVYVLREAGFALSGLALWLLVLLSPLHQASQAIGALREAGVLPAGSWTLCQAVKPATGDDRPVPQCPFQSLGPAIDGPPTGLSLSLPPLILITVLGPSASQMHRHSMRRRFRQPRAPPLLQGAWEPAGPA